MKQIPRLLTPEENFRFQLVQAVAFEVPIDYEKEKNSHEDPVVNENCRKIGGA